MKWDWSIFSFKHEFCLDAWTAASEVSDRIETQIKLYGGEIERSQGMPPGFFKKGFGLLFLKRHLFVGSLQNGYHEHFESEAKKIIHSRLGNAEHVKKHTVIYAQNGALAHFMDFILKPHVQSILMVPAKHTAYIVPANLRDHFKVIHGEITESGEVTITKSKISSIWFSSNGKLNGAGSCLVTHLKGAYK